MRDVRKMGRNINIDIDLSNWKGGRDYNIMVPHNCNLNLRTSSGDVDVTGVGGTLSFQSSSGDISARIISGNTLIVTASGDITVEDLDGKRAARTASGDIHTQTLGLRELSAATASGDIELDLTRLPEGNCEIRTISGDLNLYLPPAASFRAEVHTLSGSVRTASRVMQSSTHLPTSARRVLKVNGGGKTIQLNTVSGDVSDPPAQARHTTHRRLHLPACYRPFLPLDTRIPDIRRRSTHDGSYSHPQPALRARRIAR